MKIIVACPNGHRFRVDDVHRGKTVRCPHQACGVEFMIEAMGGPPQTILPVGPTDRMGADGIGAGVPAVTPIGEPDEPAGLSVGEALSQGWRVMSTHYGVLLGATLIYFAIEFAMGAVGVVPLVGVFSSLASMIITPPLAAGWSFTGVMAYRGRPVRVGDMFCGFNRFGSMLGIAYLEAAIILGCLIPAGVGIGIAAFLSVKGAPGDDAGVVGGIVIGAAGGLVSLVICVYVSLRLLFSNQVCLETGLGIVDSMQESWRATHPHVGKLLLLSIVLGGILVGTVVLCILPYFFLGLPLLVGVMGAAYCLVFPYAGSATGPRGFEVQVGSGGTGAVGV